VKAMRAEIINRKLFMEGLFIAVVIGDHYSNFCADP
jgi:hypothetical protein